MQTLEENGNEKQQQRCYRHTAQACTRESHENLCERPLCLCGATVDVIRQESFACRRESVHLSGSLDERVFFVFFYHYIRKCKNHLLYNMYL